jgi:hypothetical protein
MYVGTGELIRTGGAPNRLFGGVDADNIVRAHAVPTCHAEGHAGLIDRFERRIASGSITARHIGRGP